MQKKRNNNKKCDNYPDGQTIVNLLRQIRVIDAENRGDRWFPRQAQSTDIVHVLSRLLLARRDVFVHYIFTPNPHNLFI